MLWRNNGVLCRDSHHSPSHCAALCTAACCRISASSAAAAAAPPAVTRGSAGALSCLPQCQPRHQQPGTRQNYTHNDCGLAGGEERDRGRGTLVSAAHGDCDPWGTGGQEWDKRGDCGGQERDGSTGTGGGEGDSDVSNTRAENHKLTVLPTFAADSLSVSPCTGLPKACPNGRGL